MHRDRFRFVAPRFGFLQDATQFSQWALHLGGRIEGGVFVLGKRPVHHGCQFDDALGIGDAGVLLDDVFLVILAQCRIFDFLDLVGQEVNLLLDLLVITIKGPPVIFEVQDGAVGLAVGVPGLIKLGERVDHIQLEFAVEQGLVIVGAVHVDQQVAHAFEHLHRRRAAVDEVFPRSGVRDKTSYDELPVFAGVDAQIIQQVIDQTGVGERENGFDAALLFA